jgi:hypothetical protein
MAGTAERPPALAAARNRAPSTPVRGPSPPVGRPAFAVDSFAAGNAAAAMVVQRETRGEALTWLRGLLATRGGGLGAALPRAATRLGGWSVDRQTALLRSVRGAVDGFEIAVGAAGLLADANAQRVLGILEGAQSNDALGNRLVELFRSSALPEFGLVIAAQIPEPRLRAVLQPHARGFVAVEAVRTRNPVGGLPAALRPIHAYLTTLSNEMAAPLAHGLTPSTGARETAVEALLTPPAVAAARAAAAAAGLPAPAFVPLRYYEDLMAGVHQTVQNEFRYYDTWNRRRAMDTSSGGRVEGIATEAKARVDALFGDYGSRPAPSLTFGVGGVGGNLSDRTRIAGDPFDMVRWYVNEGSANRPAISTVQSAHNSFEDAAAAQVIENRVIEHYSGRSAPAAANERAALAATGVATAERQRQLRIIDRMWPGAASGGNVSIRAREGGTARETRGIYWGLLKTIIHEYLHTSEHPAYKTWYQGLTDSHHQTTYQEGFTDLFTLKTWRSLYPNEIAANRRLRQRVQGTTDPDLDMAAVGGDPGHYAELAEAQQLETLIGLPNMRAAYFRGNTAVLGGGRLPR